MRLGIDRLGVGWYNDIGQTDWSVCREGYMATATLEKGRLTRERIVTAAADLFRKNGFHNTSLAQILDAADLTKGGFYFHFKSKEELGYAVIDYMRDFWVENVLKEVAKEKGAVKKIERGVNTSFLHAV